MGEPVVALILVGYAVLLTLSVVCFLKGQRRIGVVGVGAAVLPLLAAMVMVGAERLVDFDDPEEEAWTLGIFVVFPLLFLVGSAVLIALAAAAWHSIKPARSGSWWESKGPVLHFLVVLPGLVIVAFGLPAFVSAMSGDTMVSGVPTVTGVEPGADLSGLNLDGEFLEFADLRGLQAVEATFVSANLRGADLRGADMTGADLRGVTLSSADLSEAILIGADFSAADPTRSPPHGTAVLSGSRFDRARLDRARFDNAKLDSAHLTNVSARSASFRAADLQGADLTGADLQDADLSAADLSGARLTGALLDGVTWGNTRCPDETSSHQHEGTCQGHLDAGQLGRGP